MRESKTAYREVVKQNWLTGEILKTEIIRGHDKAQRFCEGANQTLSEDDTQNDIAWYIKRPSRGPATIPKRRRKSKLPKGRLSIRRSPR
jgi:hypothetical protein